MAQDSQSSDSGLIIVTIGTIVVSAIIIWVFSEVMAF